MKRVTGCWLLIVLMLSLMVSGCSRASAPVPAAFTTSDLSISPAEADSGEDVTISVLVTNTGDLAGSYEVTLKIDNAAVATKEVTLAGGAGKRVTFTNSQDVAGSYTVSIDDLSGVFVVKEVAPPSATATFTTSSLSISPAEVDIGKSITISVLVTNTGDITGSYEVTLKIDNVAVATKEVTLAGGASQTVTFTTAKNAAGTYTVDVNDLPGTFTVKTAPASTPPPESAPDSDAVEITVTARYASFQPSTITVTKGQTVKLTVTSTDTPHTFTINELGINISVGAGQTVTREFTVEQAGTFTFYCAVPGHRDAGMEGTLEATE